MFYFEKNLTILTYNIKIKGELFIKEIKYNRLKEKKEENNTQIVLSIKELLILNIINTPINILQLFKNIQTKTLSYKKTTATCLWNNIDHTLEYTFTTKKYPNTIVKDICKILENHFIDLLYYILEIIKTFKNYNFTIK